MFAMFGRVLYPLLGIAFWQKGFEGLEDNDDVNHEFVKKCELPIKILVFVLIISGILIDIMVWRWRHLAKYIAYHDLIFLMVHGFVPLNYGNFKHLV